jgi:outer membrane protein OmpA-like peptidoglycan-associated protein
MFASLLNTLDSRSVSDVARATAQPEQSVSRALESCVAAIFGGLAGKSGDTGFLKRILDMAPGAPGTVSWSQMASSAADPNSSLMISGKHLLAALFGSGESAVTSAISRAHHLPPASAATLLTMAAPVVTSFIGKQVRDSGMTMASLASILQHESGTIQSALPSGLQEIFWPGAVGTATVSPVVAQAVRRERHFNWLIPALICSAIGIILAIVLTRPQRPTVGQIPSARYGEASRVAIPPACTLPANVRVRPGGPASRLQAYLRNPAANTLGPTGLNWNVAFSKGSAILLPTDQADLRDLAMVLKNCPNVHMTIVGYTDNTGSAAGNLRLSRARAASVVAALESRGVPANRLTAEGRGQANPIASNSTPEGRARNRRVDILVTQQ